MQETIGRFLIAITVLVSVLAVIACGGADTGQPITKEDTGQPITKKEAATFLEGFLLVYLDGKAEDLPSYLSSTCSQEDVDAMMLGARLANGFVDEIDNEIDVIVDADKLAVEIISNDRATIPSQQPDGIATMILNGESLPLHDTSDEPLDLVREDGRWVTTVCVGAAQKVSGGMGG
jgi:hypothetical protein